MNINNSAVITVSLNTEFEDIRINVSWGHIAGRWYGNRKVRPILALHGWLENLGTWQKLIPLLPKHVGVLCIDFPGHGQSSKYPPGKIYHTLDFVHVIKHIMKEKHWQNVSFLAHSLGAMVAFLYASLFPHKVDMIIAIDLVYPQTYLPIDNVIEMIRQNMEKNLLLDERQCTMAFEEPPSYTYEELKELLYSNSGHSLELENCKYVLDRNIKRSSKFPTKYYFSRDPKVKYFIQFQEEDAFFHEMAKNIKNVPYLILKGSRSLHITIEEHEQLFEILRKNNDHFEFFSIDGTHHLHLNNAEEVSAVINPFINRHFPLILDRSCLNEYSYNGKRLVKSKNKSNCKK